MLRLCACGGSKGREGGTKAQEDEAMSIKSMATSEYDKKDSSWDEHDLRRRTVN